MRITVNDYFRSGHGCKHFGCGGLFRASILGGLMMFIGTAAWGSEQLWVTLSSELLSIVDNKIVVLEKIENQNNGRSLIKIDESQLGILVSYKHTQQSFGGPISHYSKEEGIEYLYKNFAAEELSTLKANIFSLEYSLKKPEIVNLLVPQVNEDNLIAWIKKFSEFKNRYYKSTWGVEAVNKLKTLWEGYAKNRPEVTIELFKHSKFAQPSLILTIPGKNLSFADEVVVLGGHVDSTAGYVGGNNVRAPGADDNASGIAVLTETLRILFANDYHPDRTIKFIAYAAEEAGLLGSKEIASNFKKNKVKVVGVLQLDMTNYRGSASDIYLITDYTNKTQNEFLGKLIDGYLHVSWGQSSCGYGCSDHASWNAQGMIVSFPFEAEANQCSPDIHTERDLIDATQGRAEHSINFAKLALAYAVELGSVAPSIMMSSRMQGN
ncbi:MAG: M20/M25/M40 family metallo-hydrolase [Oligoflexia bacterium]|nr:M20/M25/M40 family metallo-hydrolase [Oligoflexia bacterium]